MQVGEAYAKVTSEVSQYIAEQTGLNTGVSAGDLDMEDLSKIMEVGPVFKPYLYDGATKDFIAARGKKRAQAYIDELSEAGVDFTSREAADQYIDAIIDKWYSDMLTVLAMGYSFASPEYSDTARDKDGFMHLCRVVDRDLITIQVARFGVDEMLREGIGRQMATAVALTSHMFGMLGKPFNKFGLRDFFFQVWATVALNCFIAGHKVRELLEEEAAFEAMMKETD